MELLGWRAYGPEGPVADSTEVSDWRELDAIVGVVEFLRPPRRRIVDGGDRYWMEDGRWRAGATIWGGFVEAPREEAVRSAPALPDEAWEERRREMIADRDWPEAA